MEQQLSAPVLDGSVRFCLEGNHTSSARCCGREMLQGKETCTKTRMACYGSVSLHAFGPARMMVRGRQDASGLIVLAYTASTQLDSWGRASLTYSSF